MRALLARKPGYDIYSPAKKRQSPKRKPIPKKKKKPNPKKQQNGYGSILLIIIAASVSLFFLSGYAKITAIRTDINEKESLISDLEKKRTNLRAELEGIKSSETIIEEANLKLGMNHPSKDQILYISIPKETNTHSPLEIIQEKFQNGIGKIKSLFGR